MVGGAVVELVVVTAIVLLLFGQEENAQADLGCTREAGAFTEQAVQLTYAVTESEQTQLDRTIDVLCARLAGLGWAGLGADHRVRRAAPDRVTIEVPRGAPNATADVGYIARTARLAFYDWEANVVGPEGDVGSQDLTVTGGQAAGSLADTVDFYGAVQRAKGVEPEVDEDNTHNGLFYLVNTEEREVLEGPEPVREELYEDEQVPEQLPPDVRIEEIPPGVVIVRAQAPENFEADEVDEANEVERYYVLRDDPALGGTDIENPEQDRDTSPGGTGQPIVTFEFTDGGRAKWEAVTRKIAQRGLANLLPGQPPDLSNQHFAIVLDDALISVPQIDYQENPDGIDGDAGAQIPGGFTVQGAQDLASVLQTGALPVDLELISRCLTRSDPPAEPTRFSCG
jgi:SecD/SecF fusion protein